MSMIWRNTRIGAMAFVFAAASVPAQAETIVASHYGFLFNTAPIAVAIERGEFKKRGINITQVISSSGGGTTMRNQIASGAGYGVVGTAAVLAAFREGHDVKIVSANVMTLADLFWVSMPGSGIKSIHDLKGKKVSYTRPRSTSQTLAKMAVAAAGIKPDEIELVSLGKVGAGLAALERGDVQAALILEPIWSGRKGKYQIAFDLSNLPRMTQTVGVTTKPNSPSKAARKAAQHHCGAPGGCGLSLQRAGQGGEAGRQGLRQEGLGRGRHQRGQEYGQDQLLGPRKVRPSGAQRDA